MPQMSSGKLVPRCLHRSGRSRVLWYQTLRIELSTWGVPRPRERFEQRVVKPPCSRLEKVLACWFFPL